MRKTLRAGRTWRHVRLPGGLHSCLERKKPRHLAHNAPQIFGLARRRGIRCSRARPRSRTTAPQWPSPSPRRAGARCRPSRRLRLGQESRPCRHSFSAKGNFLPSLGTFSSWPGTCFSFWHTGHGTPGVCLATRAQQGNAAPLSKRTGLGVGDFPRFLGAGEFDLPRFFFFFFTAFFFPPFFFLGVGLLERECAVFLLRVAAIWMCRLG